MHSVIFLILICQLISSGICLFGIGETNPNNTEVTEDGMLFGAFQITSLKYPKRDSCGLQFGGAIVQLVALPYIGADDLNWYDTEQCLIFADRFNSTICCFHKDVGMIVNYYIKEIENREIGGVLAVKYRPDKFVIGANQTMFILTNMFPANGTWKYSFKKLMDLTDDSRLLTKSIVTKESQILIGTKPSTYLGRYPNVPKGKGQVLLVDLNLKNVTVLEDNYTWISGVAIDYSGDYRYHSDIIENKVWRRKWAPNSPLELVFDMSQYNNTIVGRVSAIALDSDGKLWMTLSDSYQVIQFDIDEKRIIRNIPIATPSMHSLAWGGLAYETLYVGTSTKGVNTLAVPAAGTVMGISGTGSRGWRHEKVKVASDWLA